MEAYSYLAPNKIVALCTGSQGEPRAALARIAEEQHPEIKFSRGDRVIYSARTIPGNEKAVGRVINGLIEQGIEVITDRTHLVHVSGHPRRAELEELIGWVKPQIVIPVHGEALHLTEHAALARRCGVKQVIQCRNGDLVRLSSDARIIDEVPAGRVYKDGTLLVAADARTVADRKRLSFAGAVSIALALTEDGQLADDPTYDLIGIPERDRDGGFMHEAVHDAIVETFDSLPRGRRRDPDAVAEAMRRAVRAAMVRALGQEADVPRARLGGMIKAAGEKDASMIGRLNHVAIAVRDIAKASAVYRDTLGADVSAKVAQPDHGVSTVFITLPNTKIELLEPLGEGSPIAKFLEKNPDGGIHHVCYEVPDIRAARDTLKRQGARVLGDGEPKIGAHGKPVLFLHPKDFCGTLVELEQA